MVGRTPGDELKMVTMPRHRFGRVIVVQVDDAPRAEPPATPTASATSLVSVTRETPFRAAWSRAVRPRAGAPGTAGARR